MAVLHSVVGLLALAAVVAASVTYPGRALTILNGEWEFGYRDNVPDVINFDPADATTPNTTTVPSAFDVAPPGIMGPRGTAFYRRKFTLPVNNGGLLHFSACSFYCKVFVDGKPIGDHRAGGYSPFWLEVYPSSQPDRELLVLVDDRFNATTAPTHTGGDFWNYAGITRDVILHTVPAVTYLKRVETFTQDLNGTVLVKIYLAGNTDVKTILADFSLNGAKGETKELDVKDGVATHTTTFEGLSPWSMESPTLYALQVTLNNGDDAILVRFGLRLLGMVNGRLTINNKVVKLHGYNRHTMYPDTGSALTLEQVKADVDLLVEVNANYVRGAHYPQDQRFLDLCDERGIVVWEETLGPGTTTADFENPYFMKYQLQAVGEMVEASINHPSVIFHAFYNEGPSNDPKACAGYNASANAIRQRTGSPPSRLVTWASDDTYTDKCLGIADVISFNNYPAWYSKPGDLNYTAIYWQEMVDFVQANFPEKPFTISETGAGGVYEWRNTSDPRWSQNYQTEVVTRDASFAVNNINVTGITLWQFNDIKANDDDTKKCGQCIYDSHPASLSEPWDCAYIDVTCNRPGGENHKGSVDFWRRKKAVFTAVQSIYGQAKAAAAAGTVL